jgi:hypothetical protein
MVLESLNRALGRVDSMIVGFDKHLFALPWGKKFFDYLACLVVHDI